MSILHKAKSDNYLIVRYFLKSNVSRVILLINCIKGNFISESLLNLEVQTANTNFTWLYFETIDSFVLPYINSNILYSVHLFGI